MKNLRNLLLFTVASFLILSCTEEEVTNLDIEFTSNDIETLADGIFSKKINQEAEFSKEAVSLYSKLQTIANENSGRYNSLRLQVQEVLISKVDEYVKESQSNRRDGGMSDCELNAWGDYFMIFSEAGYSMEEADNLATSGAAFHCEALEEPE